MMTQITDKVWAVEVPEDTTGIEICNYGLNDALEWMHHIDGIAAYCVDDLPPGTWRFLFTTKTATEEDAHKIVESVTTANELPVYRDYEFTMWMKSAVASLHSLLRSKRLDDKLNYALIEKMQ